VRAQSYSVLPPATTGDQTNDRRLHASTNCAKQQFVNRPRKVLAILIGADVENSKAVFAALAKFGAPIEGLSAKDFAEPDNFFRMGAPPVMVDIMPKISGVGFEEAWRRRVDVRIDDDLSVPFIAREDLVVAISDGTLNIGIMKRYLRQLRRQEFIEWGVTGTIGDCRAHSLQATKESAGQSKCAFCPFALVLSNGQQNHSVQQPEGDEV
jgi:hypothetical protein